MRLLTEKEKSFIEEGIQAQLQTLLKEGTNPFEKWDSLSNSGSNSYKIETQYQPKKSKNHINFTIVHTGMQESLYLSKCLSILRKIKFDNFSDTGLDTYYSGMRFKLIYGYIPRSLSTDDLITDIEEDTNYLITNIQRFTIKNTNFDYVIMIDQGNATSTNIVENQIKNYTNQDDFSIIEGVYLFDQFRTQNIHVPDDFDLNQKDHVMLINFYHDHNSDTEKLDMIMPPMIGFVRTSFKQTYDELLKNKKIINTLKNM